MHIKCINCGKPLKSTQGRFMLCDCGFTEAYNPDNGKFIMFVSDTKVTICLAGGYAKDFTVDSINLLLSEIINLPVENSEVVLKNRRLSSSASEAAFLSTLPSWAVIAHDFQFRNSKQYEYVIKKKYYDFAWEVLNSGQLLDMPQPEALAVLDQIMKIKDEFAPGSLLIAYEAMLYSFDKNEAQILSDARIYAEEVIDIISATDFSRNEVINFISQLNSLHYPKNDIISLIMEYNQTLKILHSKYNCDFKPREFDNLDVSIARAKCELSLMNRNNTAIKYQLVSIYSKELRPLIKSKDTTLSMVLPEYAEKYCYIVPNDEILISPVYAVKYKGKVKGIVYIGKADTYGKWFSPITDTVKRELNEALNQICKEVKA